MAQDIKGQNLAGKDLTGTPNFHRVDFSGAVMAGASLAGVNLENANLTGADLTAANLTGARLYGALLTGAVLARANLTGADLRGANLSGADLTDAITADANFDGANMRGVVIKSSQGDNDHNEADSVVETAVRPVDAPLSEDAIRKLLEDDATVNARDNDEVSGTRYFTYKTKNLAILMLFSEEIGRMTPAKKKWLLNLLTTHNANYFGRHPRVSMAAHGDCVFTGFENPTQALQCATLYLNILRDMTLGCGICVNWGAATSRIDMSTVSNNELIVDSIIPSSRLRPVNRSGEILILEDVYANPATNHELFTFEKVHREWALSTATASPVMDMICYSVRLRGE
jgi:uncharacterized protein YjbI with pentapeptide repeats